MIRTNIEIKDLGIGTTLGRTKPRVIKNNRYRRATHRINRIAGLAKHRRAAAKLYPTGAWPQRFHGHVAIGLSPSELSKARRDMVKCSGAPKGCCTSTLIAVTYGPEQDPFVRARKEQVKEYIKLWEGLSDSEKHLVRR